MDPFRDEFRPIKSLRVEEAAVDIRLRNVTIPFLEAARTDEGNDARTDDVHKIVMPYTSPTATIVKAAQNRSQELTNLRTIHRTAKATHDAINLQGGTALTALLGPQQHARHAADDDDDHDATHETNSSVPLPQSDAVSNIQAWRETLPIFRCKRDLLRHIDENRVTVVVGETGSGKTTQLVQYLYEAKYATNGKLIGCTQPRRMAAIGVARRVADEMNCTIGDLVGYAIHLDDHTTSKTRIKFMTDGLLLREVVSDPLIEKYSVIVMDEAHERSVDTDVLLGIMKTVLRERSDFRLIVTSATMDTDKFAAFFGDAPVFFIEGKTFPVVVRHSDAPVNDYVAAAVLAVCETHTRTAPDSGDILVFMTGREDVEGTCELIKQRLDGVMFSDGANAASTLCVMPCYSERMTPAMQQRVLSRLPAGMRKCVVATNVAETSLTIDGIRYVIDSGFMKTKVLIGGMNTLDLFPVSQAQAKQRAGRAGRTQDGICIRLYTEAQFTQEMLPTAVPEIQRCSIETVVLTLKSIGIDDVSQFDFIDAPPAVNLRAALKKLWLLDAIDDSGRITKEGRAMLDFPTEPALAKVLVHSVAMKCATVALNVVSMLAANPRALFLNPRGREDEAAQKQSRFHHPSSDHLTLANTMDQFLAARNGKEWCASHFLSFDALRKARSIREQLLERMRRHVQQAAKGAEEDGGGALMLGRVEEQYDRFRECLAECAFEQSARRSGMTWTEYSLITQPSVKCSIHPTSAIRSRGMLPEYVVFNETLATADKYYLSLVTAVNGEWLAKASKGLLTVHRPDGRGAATSRQSSVAGTVATTGGLSTSTISGPTRPPATVQTKATVPAGAAQASSLLVDRKMRLQQGQRRSEL